MLFLFVYTVYKGGGGSAALIVCHVNISPGGSATPLSFTPGGGHRGRGSAGPRELFQAKEGEGRAGGMYTAYHVPLTPTPCTIVGTCSVAVVK